MEESKTINLIIKELGFENENEANELIPDIKAYIKNNNLKDEKSLNEFLNEIRHLKDVLLIDDSEFDEE